MTGWRVSAWTHPEDPGGFAPREHSIPFLNFKCSDPLEPRGAMTMTVPEAYDWANLITVNNPTDPADTSLIRLYRDGVDNTGEPDIEFKLTRFKKKITEAGEAVVELQGIDWRLAALDAAVVRWQDWEPGATNTNDPDWVYGGSNLLEGGFEDTGDVSQEFEFWHDATGGNWNLDDGTDTTSPDFTHDQSASSIESQMESDLGSVTDVIVTGEGTETDPWRITYLNPPFGNTLNLNETLTGETEIHFDETETGGWDLGGWTPAQTVSDGTPNTFGAYASNDGFAITTEQAHTGTRSLRINPLDVDTHGRYPGGQKVITGLTPGTYQAGIWIRSTSGTDPYRFVIRTIYEGPIYRGDGGLATSTGGLDSFTLTANTWTYISIPDVIIPEGTTAIIFRVANTQATGNPAVFYLDDPYFAKGKPAATLGKIGGDLLAHAQTDFAPTLVRLGYLTKGAWTDTVDSSLAAWARPDESITINRGKKYGTHVWAGDFADLGAEYDITPDPVNPDTANWIFDFWDDGNRGTTHTDIAFIVGWGVGGGLVAGRLPAASRILAEGKGGIITEQINAAQEAQTGIEEAYLAEFDITDSATLIARASHQLEEDLANRLALTVELAEGAPTPYETFRPGDTAPFAYAGTIDKHDRRISEISLEADGTAEGGPHWQVTVTASKLYTRDAAIAEAARRYLTDYKRWPDEALAGGGFPPIGSGGMATILVAASDSTADSKGKADMVCTGVNDEATIRAALARLDDGTTRQWGTVWLAEGTYYIDAQSEIYVPYGATLRGLGGSREAVVLVVRAAALGSMATVQVGGGGKLADLSIEDAGGGAET